MYDWYDEMIVVCTHVYYRYMYTCMMYDDAVKRATYRIPAPFDPTYRVTCHRHWYHSTIAIVSATKHMAHKMRPCVPLVLFPLTCLLRVVYG